MVNRAPAPQVPDRNPALHSNQIAQIVDATPEQLDSIKKYQVKYSLHSTKIICTYFIHKISTKKWFLMGDVMFMYATGKNKIDYIKLGQNIL